MKKRRRFWLLNLLIVLVIILCTAAFVIHYKNWIRIEDGEFRIVSGIYLRQLPISDIDDLGWVDRLPVMVRDHGFSAWAKEKGIFHDSLNPEKKVYVFVDDLTNRKIRMVYSDSMEVYFNLADSLETVELFNELKGRKDILDKQFLEKN